LNLHCLVAAVYLAVAALGAEHAAAAFFTGITFAELVGHLAVLRGVLGEIGGLCLAVLLEIHGGLAAGDSAVTALGYYELRTAFAAYIAFTGLISQLFSSMVYRNLRRPQARSDYKQAS